MKNFILICLLAVFTFTSLQSQVIIPRCGQHAYEQYLEAKYPGFSAANQGLFNRTQTYELSELSTRNKTLRIPVVFHVIYHSDKQNVADELILRELDILNDAFSHNHADTGNIRSIFKPMAGVANIEFVLATTDPEGNPSTGITRTYTETAYFGDEGILLGNLDIEKIESIKYSAKGGYDGWPADRYMNVWIADMGFNFLGLDLVALLGLATPPRYPNLPDNWPPGAVDGIKDGLIIQHQTISDNNPYVADLFGVSSKGRTLVHEVGHYLGLRHINGDDDNCAATDGIDDTPNMHFSMQGTECPSADMNSCDDPVGDLPDMWENYMDYSNDMCQGLFTHGQVEHMRKVLTFQRDTLATSANRKLTSRRDLIIYPNPVTDELHFNLPDYTGYRILNIAGQTVAAGHNKLISAAEVANLEPGVYILQVTDKSGALISGRFIRQ